MSYGLGIQSKVAYGVLLVIFTALCWPFYMLKWAQVSYVSWFSYEQITQAPFDFPLLIYLSMILFGSLKFCVNMQSNELLPQLTHAESAKPIIAIFLAQVCWYFSFYNPQPHFIYSSELEKYVMNYISMWQLSPYTLVPLVIALLGKFLLGRKMDIPQMVGLVIYTAGALYAISQYRLMGEQQYYQCLNDAYYPCQKYFSFTFSFIGFFASIAGTFLLSAAFVQQEQLLTTKSCNVFELMFKQGISGLAIVIPAILIFAIIQAFTSEYQPNILHYTVVVFTSWQVLLLTLALIVGFGVMITVMFVLIYNGSAFRTVVAASFGFYSVIYFFHLWMQPYGPLIVLAIGFPLTQATLSCGQQQIAQVREEQLAKDGNESFVDMNATNDVNN